MNKILLKLAQETDVWCDQNHAGDEFYAIRWEEHFAELIVRECVNIADTAEPYQSSDLIKKHFGVE